MAYFLFVDESGHDRRKSPYEVLGGICVEDRDLWKLVCALNEAEERILGIRYSREKEEIKAKKFLKTKVFRLAKALPPIPEADRMRLSRECILQGESAGREQLAALAQAKLAFVEEALNLCLEYRCRAFASIVDIHSPVPDRSLLRKDYAYLFERFFYYLEDRSPIEQGIVVFDELDKSAAHILLDQMEAYFRNFRTGRTRSSQVIPEPFFVHSDLTSLIQIADLIAYITSWGFRLPAMKAAARPELQCFVRQVAELRYLTKRYVQNKPDFEIWSFTFIEDLRGIAERQA